MQSSQISSYFSPSSTSETKLFHTLFTPNAASTKATLLIIHGMQEHSGRYTEIAAYFADQGFAVLTSDHLGHGKSVKDKKDIGFFQLDRPDEKLVSDAEAVGDYLHQQYPEVPHFVLGHSMGSFVTRCLLQKTSNKFTGAVLVGTGGPLAGISLIKAYLSLANKIAPKHPTYLNTLFNIVNNKHFKKDQDFDDTSWLSINPANRKAFTEDELCGIPFSNNAFFALFSIYKKATARHWAAHISKTFPLLFVSGQNDPIGDFGKGVVKTVNNLKQDGFKNVNSLIYPEMRHEVLNEEIRKDVFNDINNWLTTHL
ncbi:alpha/beta fold hydrolase [Chryseobacterium kwangjuense]|uniref:Alpha/beta fold hydrolase n=1 Tax=Chryseobacterium kwangjuense TaxID=267125 RepID=A0ABW9JZ37_9FLAO